MSSFEITAEQARNYSQAADLGVEKILEEISQCIDANAKAGEYSITRVFNQNMVDHAELTEVVSAIELKGFKVDRSSQPSGNHVIVVSW
ncbi:hypothetical protein [Aeromonas schubertii]|uniref:hypothetical protein n=1 Tax=Aeromonas schubertii TaxID=652 RepID=UPI001CC3F451|nr:hypothetical protein [Aeromonas schubertii]MBZ6073350.1 hypothetical protein [Aeromonas schubertii]